MQQAVIFVHMCLYKAFSLELEALPKITHCTFGAPKWQLQGDTEMYHSSHYVQ